MDADDLHEMAEDPRFISGIYNCCDRWCERCRFTERCFLYATEEKRKEERRGREPAETDFMEDVAESFALVRKMLEDWAAKEGVDLNQLVAEGEALAAAKQKRRKSAGERALTRSAKDYALATNAWFKKHEKLFRKKGKQLAKTALLELPGRDPEAEAQELSDAVDIIRWYQPQIFVKLSRALMTLEDLDSELEDDPALSDMNGSAKVALIAIDRSLLAWAKLHERFGDRGDSILDLLVQLERLRRQAETQFPKARAFVRPGFDDGSSPVYQN